LKGEWQPRDGKACDDISTIIDFHFFQKDAKFEISFLASQ
jgi:hypothetical protein